MRNQTFRIAVRQFPPFESAIHQQWQAFEAEAQTGLTLDLVPLDLHDLEQALFTTNGMANGDWDVAFINTDWIAAMHAQRAAADLAPLLKSDPPEGYPQAWSPSLLRLQRMGDAILGVPYHDGPECLIYRRDLIDDPPTTWDSFHALARSLTRPGLHGTGLYGTAFAAFPDGHNTVYDFLLQLWTRNGELFAPDGRVQFHTPEAEAALTFYRDIVTDPTSTHPASPTLDSVASGNLFASGSVAMMVNWFGFAAYAQTSPGSAVRGLVEIAPIPHAPGGRSASLNVYWILSIASGSPHPGIAWQFLRHTQTPAMDLLTSTCGAIGTRRSTWQNQALNSEIPFYHQLEALHQNAREIPQRPDWPQIAATIDRLVTAAVTTTKPIANLLAEATSP